MISNVRQLPFDIHANSLLAATFSSPREVLDNPVLSGADKRCVLAAWASDAFAVEGHPWLRQLPGAPDPVPLRDILAALQELDNEDGPPPCTGAMRAPVLEEPAMAVGF